MTPVSRDLADASARAALAQGRAAGSTLPREFYVDPAVHREDLQRIFLDHWLVAGHIDSIARVGDYFLYDIGFESFIVVRSSDEVVSVLVNVCSHRGSRVCIEEYGHCRQFDCPLCGWTFALDGTLIAAKNLPAGFDRASHSLKAAESAVVDGLVLFRLSHDAARSASGGNGRELDQLRNDLDTFLSPYQLAETRIAYHRRYLCPANWKLVTENFLELHNSAANYAEMRQVNSDASPCPALNTAIDRTTSYSCVRRPIRTGFDTQSQDGKLIAPPLGDSEQTNGFVTVFRLLSSWIIAYSDHAVIVRLTPIDAQVTEMDVTWLVRSSAVEGVDFDAQKLAWLWRANVERALKLATDHQLGVNSRQYRTGPFTPDEHELDHWVSWYLSRFVS